MADAADPVAVDSSEHRVAEFLAAQRRDDDGQFALGAAGDRVEDRQRGFGEADPDLHGLAVPTDLEGVRSFDSRAAQRDDRAQSVLREPVLGAFDDGRLGDPQRRGGTVHKHSVDDTCGRITRRVSTSLPRRRLRLG
jgi:hypothetical protein